jgi:hypothetical protein
VGAGASRGDAVGATGLSRGEAASDRGSADRGGSAEPAAPAESPRAVLDRWEKHGAVWRVARLTPERAVVDLCACTGEPVDRLESADRELIAYLRTRPSSEA